MTTTLENLSPILCCLHVKLCTTTNTQKVSQEYIIDNLAVKVLVELERQTIDREIPKEALSCAVKQCKDIAKVTVSPENDKVIEAVKSHFKTALIPAGMGAPSRFLFDSVTVNDKKVI